MKAYLKAKAPRLVPAVRYARSLMWRVLPVKQKFISIYRNRNWGSEDASQSGTGSNLQQTSTIRARLPEVFQALKIRSLLDIPCGDFFWMKELDLSGIDYLGADIVPQIIAANRRNHGGVPTRRFVTLDIRRDALPRADLILCRDCLVHLSHKDIATALANVKRSGSTYLLTTTFPSHGRNQDVVTGYWRPLDLESPPFDLPEPVLRINENCPEPGYQDKSLGLWKTADLG